MLIIDLSVIIHRFVYMPIITNQRIIALNECDTIS